MLKLHHAAVARMGINRDLKYLVRDYFSLSRTQALMPALLAQKLGQADLVLCLLRLRDAHAHRSLRASIESYITMLVGHPICIGPSCLQRYHDKIKPPPIALDRSPRVTFVTPDNPRQPNTDAHLRWCEYRVGRTVAQLRARGVTPKDVRLARRNGWIRTEEHAS